MDVLVLVGFVALFLGGAQVASEWRHPLKDPIPIDLTLAALPKYALFSFARGWLAYFFSFVFTIVVASWAFFDARAHKYILPALDILQSIPVTAFPASRSDLGRRSLPAQQHGPRARVRPHDLHGPGLEHGLQLL